jgi:hypothetical protein
MLAVLVLICVGFCVAWRMALHLGAASMAMIERPPRDRGGRAPLTIGMRGA